MPQALATARMVSSRRHLFQRPITGLKDRRWVISVRRPRAAWWRGGTMRAGPSSKEKEDPMGILGDKSHTTTTLLAFSNPPSSVDPEPIALECVSAGLDTIGIPGPHDPSDLID